MFGRDSTDRKEHLKDPYPGLFQNPPLLYTAARTTAATFSSSARIVPNCARASSVPARPRCRNTSSSAAKYRKPSWVGT